MSAQMMPCPDDAEAGAVLALMRGWVEMTMVARALAAGKLRQSSATASVKGCPIPARVRRDAARERDLRAGVGQAPGEETAARATAGGGGYDPMEV
jgi:hypothetical protein